MKEEHNLFSKYDTHKYTIRIDRYTLALLILTARSNFPVAYFLPGAMKVECDWKVEGISHFDLCDDQGVPRTTATDPDRSTLRCGNVL